MGRFDPLSDVLQTLRLSGSLFFLWKVSTPFGTPAPAGQELAPVLLPGAQQIVSYHVIVEGDCWGGLLGHPPMHLRQGDVLLIPRGDAYAMASSEAAFGRVQLQLPDALAWFRAMAAGELPLVFEDGGGGRGGATVACGFLGCDVRPYNPIASALPGAVRIASSDSGPSDRLRGLIDYAVAEALDPGPGSRGVLIRLGELMFMEVVRRCLQQSSDLPTGWLAGLRDPTVGRCLALIHRAPGDLWTLASLAARTGCSRSGLADRFSACVGEPPMQYLTRWRMIVASELLRDDALTVAAVAERVGYGSGPAFSRAFARVFGMSPAHWRQRRSGP